MSELWVYSNQPNAIDVAKLLEKQDWIIRWMEPSDINPNCSVKVYGIAKGCDLFLPETKTGLILSDGSNLRPSSDQSLPLGDDLNLY